MATEFEYQGVKYKIGKMNLMTEAKVAKRMLPIVTQVKALSMAWAAITHIEAGVDKDSTKEAVDAAIEARNTMWLEFADALAQLPDDDLEFIINECMSIAERQESGGGWSRIWDYESQRPMYHDMKLPVVFAIVGAVLQLEFRDFFS
jgi:hypothetical protein